MTTTEKVLAGMLKEGTGIHMLDSGGTFGRAWQQNQAVVDFRQQSQAWYQASVYHNRLELSPTLNVFHFLVERLEYAPTMQSYFQEYEYQADRKRTWLALMEEFPCWLEYQFHSIGISGLGVNNEPLTVNTYTYESLLSQVLQYTQFTVEIGVRSYTPDPGDPVWNLEGEYIALQIHGGADVRGGYTAPRLFRILDSSCLLDDQSAYLQCTRDSKHTWYTDDSGAHWYANCSAYPDLHGSDVVVTEDHLATCPVCGGLLEIWPY
jgi:hypothetical protein